jgi:hypothetical protein
VSPFVALVEASAIGFTGKWILCAPSVVGTAVVGAVVEPALGSWDHYM